MWAFEPSRCKGLMSSTLLALHAVGLLICPQVGYQMVKLWCVCVVFSIQCCSWLRRRWGRMVWACGTSRPWRTCWTRCAPPAGEEPARPPCSCCSARPAWWVHSTTTRQAPAPQPDTYQHHNQTHTTTDQHHNQRHTTTDQHHNQTHTHTHTHKQKALVYRSWEQTQEFIFFSNCAKFCASSWFMCLFIFLSVILNNLGSFQKRLAPALNLMVWTKAPQKHKYVTVCPAHIMLTDFKRIVSLALNYAFVCAFGVA